MITKSNRCEKQSHCATEYNCRRGNHCPDFYPINSAHDELRVGASPFIKENESVEPLDFDDDFYEIADFNKEVFYVREY